MKDEPIAVAAYGPDDLAPVVRLLASCLPIEGITVESFARRVLLDPNFDRDGGLVARGCRDEVIGFMLAIGRRYPLEDAPDDRDQGWITLFAVAPAVRRHGAGSRLLAAAEAYLSLRGCSSVLVSPYAPGYWIPGVDEAAYPEAASWLKRRGYDVVARPLSMAVSLDRFWRTPARFAVEAARLHNEGISIAPLAPDHALPLLDLLSREFRGDWQRAARETMGAIFAGGRAADSLWVAMSGERCVGFAQYEGERFGPIGVTDRERGRGIGAALMYRILESMQSAGGGRAFFLWTNDTTADRLYRPAGFQEARRFSVLKKPIVPGVPDGFMVE